ncbi:MAG: aspartate kinase [Chlorobi bacterium]|nr:aspartate kinase [Chlorobiota bacterium]
MLVFKFGGSVLKDVAGLQAMAGTVRNTDGPVIVVVSAFGKTTDALEEVARLTWKKDPTAFNRLGKIRNDHLELVRQLIPDGSHAVYAGIEGIFGYLEKIIKDYPADREAFTDEVASCGELVSSVIVHHVLANLGIRNHLLDVRDLLVTDNLFRAARVNWPETSAKIQERCMPLFEKQRMLVTQGYIGRSQEGNTTTLGREGSDFTAAIFGYVLNAGMVVCWKDVPGVMNADPKEWPGAVLLPKISYQEAAELTWYGAKVIHPRTIKPLHNRQIPLIVRGLHTPENEGTLIHLLPELENPVPVYVRKPHQVLLSVVPRDYSFTNDHLQKVFRFFSRMRMRINLVQNSALSVSFCIDDPGERLAEILYQIQHEYEVYHNRPVELVTIRHYRAGDTSAYPLGGKILLEQRTRLTVQYVVEKQRNDG